MYLFYPYERTFSIDLIFVLGAHSRNKEQKEKRKSKDKVMYTKMVDFLTNYKAAIPILTEYETIIMSQKKKLSPNSVPFHSNSPKKL